MDKKMNGFFRVEKRSAQTQHKSAQQGPCVSLGGPNAENGLSNPLILGFKEFRILSFNGIYGVFKGREKWGELQHPKLN